MFLKKAFMLGAAGLSLSGVAIAAQSESLTPALGGTGAMGPARAGEPN